MPSFYRSFDCFVLPTRGEGFGLPFIEAMACNVPCIGPAWGGNTEFMSNDNSLLVGGNVIPIEDQRFLHYQPQYSGQKWFDIDEGELSKKMRWVYENQTTAKVMGSVGGNHVREHYTWHKTAGMIFKRLIEIESELGGK